MNGHAHLRDGEDEREVTAAKYRNWEALDERKSDPFKDLIQRDPVVCDHCFLRRYCTVSKDWWRGDLGGWQTYERWLPVAGRQSPVPADMPAHGMRLACGNCGYRNEKHRPVSKDEVIEFTANIAETLEAKQIDFDRAALFEIVEDRASEPELQCRQDSGVWSPAVRQAIRR